MPNKKVIDIDSEFDGLEDFFDENAIRQRTGVRNYCASAKNKIREKNRKTSTTEKWKQNQKLGSIKKYEQDLEYYNNRKMLLRQIKGKKVVTPFGKFDSGGEFNEHGFVKCKFQDCRKMMPHLYYFEEEGPGDPTYEDVLYTPFGIFSKVNQSNISNSGGKDRAFAAAKKNKDEIALKYRDKYAWWNKVAKMFPKKYYIKTEIKREWNKK